MNYSKFEYCILNESPWILILSTASFAVLFLDFEVYGIENCMLGWFGFVSQAANAARKTVLTNIGGYAGSIISSSYGTKPNHYIYGGVTYTPSNYNTASINFLKNLADAYRNKDIEKIYQGWRILACNPEGIFSTNYGKLCNTINAMTNEHNRNVDPKYQVTQTGFFENFNISIDPNSLNLNEVDQYNSFLETAKIEIVNRKSQGLLEYRRNINEDNVEGIANLGLQSNNDYIAIVKYDKNTGGIHVCYVDGKKLGEADFRLKLNELASQGYVLESLPKTRFIFGCNVYMVATNNDNIILNKIEKKAVLNFIERIAIANPDFFKDYKNSSEFIEFEKTGDVGVLSSSIYPFPKILCSNDFRKYLKYNKVTDQQLIDKFISYDDKSKFGSNTNVISIIEETTQNGN